MLMVVVEVMVCCCCSLRRWVSAGTCTSVAADGGIADGGDHSNELPCLSSM